MKRKAILIDGLTAAELAAMPDLEEFVVIDEPISFRVGQAEVLAQFSRQDRQLRVELAVIESGGEGVLPALIEVIEARARRTGLTAIEWIAYATDCAVPNPKLTRVLERLGFEISMTDKGARCYARRVSTNDSLLRRQ